MGTEDDVLLAIAAVDLEPERLDRLRGSVTHEADWTTITRKALEHGIGGLLCKHLLSNLPDLLTPDLQHAASAFIESYEKANTTAVGELFEVLDALSDAGVFAIPFKGPVLAQSAYGDVSLRAFRDLDILILEKDIGRMLEALGRIGYVSNASDLKPRHRDVYYRNNGEDILFAGDKFALEPHWTFAPRSLSADLDMVGMFERVQQVALHDRNIPYLSAEDALIVLGLHGSKERWTRLLWIVDVAEHLKSYPDLDWDITLERARQAGIQRMVLLGVGLAVKLLNAPVPDWLRGLIADDRTCTRLIRRVEGRLFRPWRTPPSVFDLSWFSLCMRERLSDRLRYVIRTIVTPQLPHLRLIALPEACVWAYPSIKIARDYLVLPLWLIGNAVLTTPLGALRSKLSKP